MNPPIYFKSFEDVKNQFGNVITTYCKTYSDGGYDDEGLPESLISDFYILTKHDISEYTLQHFHSEKWFGEEQEQEKEDMYFYCQGTTQLRKNLHTSNKHLYRTLREKIDKNKEPELYDILSSVIDYNK